MLLTATLVGRLPTAMAPLALLLAARADHAGTALGALLAALYALCGAVDQPLLGRAVDRRRLSSVALPAAAVAGSAFTALAAMSVGAVPVLHTRGLHSPERLATAGVPVADSLEGAVETGLSIINLHIG